MAYHRKNLLKQIYFIQEYTLKKQKKGVKNTQILKNIFKIYPISKSTFYEYLGINAKAELRAMNVDFEELKEESDYINSIIPEE